MFFPEACSNWNYQDVGWCYIRHVYLWALSQWCFFMWWLTSSFRCLLEYCWNMFMSSSFNGYLTVSAERLCVPFSCKSAFIKVDLFLFLRRFFQLISVLTFVVGCKWRTEQWNWLTCLDWSLENEWQVEEQTQQLGVVSSVNLSKSLKSFVVFIVGCFLYPD